MLRASLSCRSDLRPKLFDFVALSPDAQDSWGPLRNGVKTSDHSDDTRWLGLWQLWHMFTSSLSSLGFKGCAICQQMFCLSVFWFCTFPISCLFRLWWLSCIHASALQRKELFECTKQVSSKCRASFRFLACSPRWQLTNAQQNDSNHQEWSLSLTLLIDNVRYLYIGPQQGASNAPNTPAWPVFLPGH